MANMELRNQRESSPENVRQRPVVLPLVDIYENKEEFLLVADLPGVTSDELTINVENSELTLGATRSTKVEGASLSGEYREVDYQRAFVLPQGIDREHIDAELKNGVLQLHLPKAEALRPRQIQVRSS